MKFDDRKQINQNISNYKYSIASVTNGKYINTKAMNLLNKNALAIEEHKLDELNIKKDK